MSGDDARNRLVAAGERLAAAGLVYSSEGNLSVRLDASTCLVTPAGSNLGCLDPEELVEVSIDASEIPVRATSEVQLHLELYRRRPEVWAVVHAHPVKILALANEGSAPDPSRLPNGGTVLDRVSWIDDFPPGTRSLAQEVAKGISLAPSLVLAAHGAVTVGATVDQAVLRMIRLERLALMTRGR